MRGVRVYERRDIGNGHRVLSVTTAEGYARRGGNDFHRECHGETERRRCQADERDTENPGPEHGWQLFSSEFHNLRHFHSPLA